MAGAFRADEGAEVPPIGEQGGRIAPIKIIPQ